MVSTITLEDLARGQAVLHLRRNPPQVARGRRVPLRPAHRHHVWSWDFVRDRTDDGGPLKLMMVLDEWSRECLAIHVAPRTRATDVLEVSADLMAAVNPSTARCATSC
jgi:transposase InsO family protein